MRRTRTTVWSAAAVLVTTCLATGIVGATGGAGPTPDATVRPAVFVVPAVTG